MSRGSKGQGLFGPSGRKKAFAFLIVLAVIVGAYGLWSTFGKDQRGFEEISIHDVLGYTSERGDGEQLVLASDEDPMYGLIAAPAACWYDIGGTGDDMYGLKALLFAPGGELDLPQSRVVENTGLSRAMSLGRVGYAGSVVFEALGSSAEVSRDVAGHLFTRAAGAILVDDTPEGYELGLIAAPMASYLNIPVIVGGSGEDWDEARGTLGDLDSEYVIALGSRAEETAERMGLKAVLLRDPA